MPTLLVRPPAKSLKNGIVSHINDERNSIDFEKANKQWLNYIEIFREKKWSIRIIEKDDDLPDSVFIEDGIINIDSFNSTEYRLILASPGNHLRKNEINAIENYISKNLKLSNFLYRINSPATLDGGDILKIPKERLIYIGNSMRTNEKGIEEFKFLVEPLGWSVIVVKVKKALHLKSMITALPNGKIIGFEPLIEDVNVFHQFISIPEPEGVAIVILDPNQKENSPLLISSTAIKTKTLLESKGYNLITCNVSEFEKLEGCVTCLSVRMRNFHFHD